MCGDESKLVRLVSGELDDKQRRALSAHLDQCPACRQAYQQLTKTWAILDAWQPAPPGHDLTAAVLARATEPARRRFAWARAAAVFLAVAVGMLAGTFTPLSAPSASAGVSDEEVAERLGLDGLAGDHPLFAAALAGEDAGLEEETP